jgi:hypothetical protein
LLTREQLCAYLGGLSWDTVKKILPVRPLDLGANVLRYSRPQIDAWIDRCPAKPMIRLQESPPDVEDAAPAAVVDLSQDRLTASIDRVRARTQQDGQRWRKRA